MPSKPSVTGKKSHTLFLRLDKQQLVKRVLVFKQMRKFGSGVMDGQRQELPFPSVRQTPPRLRG